MNYELIKPDSKIYPGQYLYHAPTNQIVLCSIYFKDKKTIKVMTNGQFIEDKVHRFRLIALDKTKAKKSKPFRRKRCGTCKKPPNYNNGGSSDG